MRTKIPMYKMITLQVGYSYYRKFTKMRPPFSHTTTFADPAYAPPFILLLHVRFIIKITVVAFLKIVPTNDMGA